MSELFTKEELQRINQVRKRGRAKIDDITFKKIVFLIKQGFKQNQIASVLKIPYSTVNWYYIPLKRYFKLFGKEER